MSEIPNKVIESALWKRLAQNRDLEHVMKDLRSQVEVLAAKIAELHPGLTDHSIIHLDALWEVAGHVLSPEEVGLITPGEAFVLGGAFYFHDIGMAIGATPGGPTELKAAESFKSEEARLLSIGFEEADATMQAMRYAARADHARFAIALAQGKMPGTDQYLIGDAEVREHWSEPIGQVAASHHWSINELKRQIGDRGAIPDATGKEYDLGYVACLLRVIDYAHINKDRASVIERLLRPHIPLSSIVHWDAQKNIAGPIRKDNQLIYSSTKKIESVDGWWTFYEMVRGLDVEITTVREYLAGRVVSSNRFSLEGVKGVKSPQDFAKSVCPKDFEPIDIRFRPDSMERLVELLGGRTLYGNDLFAPIRELLQNARDAIELFRAQAANPNTLEPPSIQISILDDVDGRYLEVTDNGIGMSEHVVSNYLLGIAADYWHSADYYSEHGKGLNRKFTPVGRFGIGFLSVFMLGDSVEVITQRRGGSMLVLNLHGIGQRGTLKIVEGYKPGTTVRVRLSKENSEKFLGLADVVRSRIPMLQIPILITELGVACEVTPGWWKSINQNDFVEFMLGAAERKVSKADVIPRSAMRQYFSARQATKDITEQWHGDAPEVVTDHARVIGLPANSGVLVCSKGFLVSYRDARGILGLVDVDELELTAARNQILDWNAKTFWDHWANALDAQLIGALNCIDSENDIPARYRFLVQVGKIYRQGLLAETSLRWISVKQSPGELRLMSPATFADHIKSEREVIICYGASVWSGEMLARRMFSSADSVPVTTISSEGQPEVGSYDDGDVAIGGSLQEHFNSAKYTVGEPKDALLLMATLEVVAKAWGCTADNLNFSWKRQKRALFGRIERPLQS